MITPCIKHCRIDKLTQLCQGCDRSIDEIREWTILTDDQRQAVIDRISKKCKK